jgi:hypothetical protein
MPALAALTCTALALALTACSGPSPATPRATPQASQAADTIRKLGAVPIPTRPAGPATPTATEHHLQLLAMGDTVHADLPGASAVLTAGGPEETPIRRAGKVPDRAVGTITVTVRDATGPLTLSAPDFTSRDETGTAIPLTSRGPAGVTARPGHPATLTLRGTYEAGAAELTWRHDGKVIAVWDFNIELD